MASGVIWRSRDTVENKKCRLATHMIKNSALCGCGDCVISKKGRYLHEHSEEEMCKMIDGNGIEDAADDEFIY